MKAVQINKYGGIEVLEIKEDAPKPIPSKDQVLIEVYAAGLNPVDWKIREGYLQQMTNLEFPVVMGGDFSGVVIEVEKEVSEFTKGDKVYGSALVLNGGSGAFAQFATANIKNTAKKPSIDFSNAAALPLVGSSAIQALKEHIKLQKEQKILIHGGAGGIGHIAVQIAKMIGAYVATTVNASDIDFVKQLGADEVIDYKTQKFEEILKDFDAVFDTVGGETTEKSFQVLKNGGILVSMAGEPDKELSQKYGVIGIGQFTNTSTKHLNRVAELTNNGKIKVNIDKIFPLEEITKAFACQEETHPKGKIVLKIKD